MNDQIIRYHHILSYIPRHPRSVNVHRIKNLLLDQGIEVSIRTIQRDLNALSEVFIGIDNLTNPDNSISWFWREDSPIIQLSGLTMNQALSFVLVKRYLTSLFPTNALEDLKPFFEQAETTLDAINENYLSKWSKKIAVVPPGQPLRPPLGDVRVNTVVRQSLLYEKQLKIVYEKADGQIQTYILNPIGLIVRNIITYLIASKSDTHVIRMFAIHRIKNAEELVTACEIPIGFNLQQYVDEGHMGFNVSDDGDIHTLELKLKFDKSASKHLAQMPISADQTIQQIDEFTDLVIATVPENEQLIWWILSFGQHVEVIEPLNIRQRISVIAQSMIKQYHNNENL